MIEKWELAHSPFEKDPQRYKARIRGSEDDLQKLVQCLPVECGRPFVTLSQDYNWAFYIYALSGANQSKVVEAFKSFSPNGSVVESPTLEVDKELPPMLQDILEATARTLVESAEEKPAAPVQSERSKPPPSEQPAQKAAEAPRPAAKTAGSSPETSVPKALNPQYVFSEFIVGSNNRFTHAAAQAVAENPGKIYNPFFIYGGVGLGKTHLMQAVGHHILEKNPKSRCHYVSTEKFASQVVESIRTGQIERLREQYCAQDILLIDDIQFLSGSEATQEEFFHIFNNLHEMGKQIVVTSDRPPKLLSTLEDRLRSRFEWGLISDLKAPNLETRVAILKKKSESLQIKLDEEQARYIAERAVSNIRELEGILKKIHASVNLTHESLTMTLLRGIFGEEEPKPAAAAQKTLHQAADAAKPPPVKEVPARAPASPLGGSSQQPSKPPAAAPKIEPTRAGAAPAAGKDVPEEVDPSLRPVQIVSFFPKGKESEFAVVKERFSVIVKKHKLKIRLAPIQEKDYDYEGKLDYTLFSKECKARNCLFALVLGPPPTPILTEDDFAGILSALLDDEKISLQFIPWSELSKDYRYLNCALDLSLLAPVTEGTSGK